MTSAVDPVVERLAASRVAVSARRVGWPVLLAIPIAFATGILLVAAPLPTFGAVVAGVVILIMVALGRRSAQAFVLSLGCLLVAYGFLGRGVAYVGTGSLFIGEAVMFLGLIAFVLNIDRARFGLVHWLILAFMVLGLVRTIPYISTYGQTALRDGVAWGYASFALAVADHVRPRLAGEAGPRLPRLRAGVPRVGPHRNGDHDRPR